MQKFLTFDFLITGQGIAGTLVSWHLEKAGKTVLVVDNPAVKPASSVAAGLINPVTGKRLVKSWKIETLLPLARDTYAALENELNIPIFSPLNIIRIFKNHEEENKWTSRSGDVLYAKYFVDPPSIKVNPKEIRVPFGYGELQSGAKANMDALIQAYRRKLKKEGKLLEESFQFEKLKPGENGVFYNNYFFEKVIFCEGANAIKNPYFSYLPFQLSKGEALLVEIPFKEAYQNVLKHTVSLIPMGNNLYWAGSSNTWEFDDDLPTADCRQELIQKLDAILKIPYKVIGQVAAIRPTIVDRRPLVGVHPDFPQLAILNGLGTKGASLAPYLAKLLSEHLVEGQPLDSEADIKRFEKKAYSL